MTGLSVDIKINNLAASEEMFKRLDGCFNSVGFYPIDVQGDRPGIWGKLVPDTEITSRKKEFLSEPKFLKAEEDDYLFIAYSPKFGGRFKFCVQIGFSSVNIINYLYLSAPVNCFLAHYEEWEMDIAHRVLKLSKLLWEKFDCHELTAFDNYSDDDWFYFKEDEIKLFGELTLSKCKKSHLKYWAENHKDPLTWKYPQYPEEGHRIHDNIYPDSSDWKPQGPFAFSQKDNAYLLLYGDNQKALIGCCPCCGGSFADVSENAPYRKPDEKEQAKFRDIAWKTKGGLKGVIAKLGEPDMRLGGVATDKEMYISEKIEDMICYTNISDNAVVIFKEYEGGIVVVNYAGKAKLSIVK